MEYCSTHYGKKEHELFSFLHCDPFPRVFLILHLLYLRIEGNFFVYRDVSPNFSREVISLLACLLACMLVCLLAYLLAYFLACLLACLLTCSLPCLLTCSLPCLLACLLASLLPCLLPCFLACLLGFSGRGARAWPKIWLKKGPAEKHDL